MKNKFSNVLSSLAIVAVALTIPLTAYVLSNPSLDLRISAFQSDEPVKVTVSDQRSDSFRVSWLTEKAVTGGIRLVEAGSLPIFETTASTSHTLVLKNLQPNTSYNFVLISDGKEFVVATNIATTAKVASDKGTFLIYGQVFSVEGSSFQQGGLITLKLIDGTSESQTVSTSINPAGGYQFNLSGLLHKNLDLSFDVNRNLDLEISVTPDNKSTAITKKFTLNLTTTKQVPNLYLGDLNLDIIPGVESK